MMWLILFLATTSAQHRNRSPATPSVAFCPLTLKKSFTETETQVANQMNLSASTLNPVTIIPNISPSDLTDRRCDVTAKPLIATN
jgi:hypothetical protein